MVVYAGRVAVLAFIAARLLPYHDLRLFDIAVQQVIAAQRWVGKSRKGLAAKVARRVRHQVCWRGHKPPNRTGLTDDPQ